jgi:flagellar biogenesis protein FliO
MCQPVFAWTWRFLSCSVLKKGGRKVLRNRPKGNPADSFFADFRQYPDGCLALLDGTSRCYLHPFAEVSKIFLLPGRCFSPESAKISASGTAIAESAPPMAETGFSGALLAFALIGLLGVIFVAQRFLPRLRQQLQSMGKLQSLGLLTLTPQCSVAVVRAGRETLVLGLTPHAVTLLTKTNDVDVLSGERADETSESTARVMGETRAAL